MNRYVVFLRGINVGGRNSLTMQALRQTLTNAGFEDVATYIQSGNVVLSHTSMTDEQLEMQVIQLLDDQHNLEVSVLVLDPESLMAAVAGNPFDTSDAKALHFYFLKADIQAFDPGDLDTLKAASESWHLDGRVLYLHAPDGIARSKLAAGIENASVCLSPHAT